MIDVPVPFTQAQIDDAVEHLPDSNDPLAALVELQTVMHAAAAERIWQWKADAHREAQNAVVRDDRAVHDQTWSPAAE